MNPTKAVPPSRRSIKKSVAKSHYRRVAKEPGLGTKQARQAVTATFEGVAKIVKKNDRVNVIDMGGFAKTGIAPFSKIGLAGKGGKKATRLTTEGYYIGETKLAHPAKDFLALAEEISEGIPSPKLEATRKRLGIGTQDFIFALDMKPATYKRRIARKQALPLQESESLLRIQHIEELANGAFQDSDEAGKWLREAHPYLGGQTPLASCRTEPGGRAVEDLLLGISFGNSA